MPFVSKYGCNATVDIQIHHVLDQLPPWNKTALGVVHVLARMSAKGVVPSAAKDLAISSLKAQWPAVVRLPRYHLIIVSV